MKQSLAIAFWTILHLSIFAGLVYSVAGHKDVKKGIEQSLEIGITR